MAEWLTRLIRNQLGPSRAGSSPVSVGTGYLFMCIRSFLFLLIRWSDGITFTWPLTTTQSMLVNFILFHGGWGDWLDLLAQWKWMLITQSSEHAFTFLRGFTKLLIRQTNSEGETRGWQKWLPPPAASPSLSCDRSQVLPSDCLDL